MTQQSHKCITSDPTIIPNWKQSVHFHCEAWKAGHQTCSAALSLLGVIVICNKLICYYCHRKLQMLSQYQSRPSAINQRPVFMSRGPTIPICGQYPCHCHADWLRVIMWPGFWPLIVSASCFSLIRARCHTMRPLTRPSLLHYIETLKLNFPVVLI